MSMAIKRKRRVSRFRGTKAVARPTSVYARSVDARHFKSAVAGPTKNGFASVARNSIVKNREVLLALAKL